MYTSTPLLATSKSFLDCSLAIKDSCILRAIVSCIPLSTLGSNIFSNQEFDIALIIVTKASLTIYLPHKNFNKINSVSLFKNHSLNI